MTTSGALETSGAIERLRRIISTELTPLVDRDFRYLMMTEHGNVGDTMIFQGERDFLATIPFRCKEWTTMSSFSTRHPPVPENDLLVFRGSGSFGDLWPVAPTFWLDILRRYPRNPVLFMPQTAHFENDAKLKELARAFERPGRTVVCLRDRPSFDLVQSRFNCETFLVPDMAFFMDMGRWTSRRVARNGRRLLIRRTDREANESPFLRSLLNRDDIDSSDWPTMSQSHPAQRWMSRIQRRTRRCPRLFDFFVRRFYRPAILRAGIRFVEPYEEIYATRMHGGILSLLLGKPTTFFDNSYGKTAAVFETWLSGCGNAQLIR